MLAASDSSAFACFSREFLLSSLNTVYIESVTSVIMAETPLTISFDFCLQIRALSPDEIPDEGPVFSIGRNKGREDDNPGINKEARNLSKSS